MTKPTQLYVRQGVPRGRPVRIREITEGGEAPLATIGQDLRNARLARGEDLASVSYALKIRPEHLDAIEEDRFDALPGRTYAVGFVRAYAEYAGLDPIEAVERFKTEIAGRDHVSKTAGFPEVIEEAGLSRGWLLVGAIVVVLIAYGIYYVFASGTTQTMQPVATVPSAMTAQQRPTPKVSRKPARTSRQLLEGPVQAPGAIPPSVPAAVAPGPGGQVYGKVNTNAHVVLRAKQPTRVLVQTEDGRAFINKELQPGDIYQVPNMQGLALTAEHGSAVEILLDGKSVGNAGTTAGAAEALPLDRESLAKRSQAPSSGQ